tara:strand:+ start:615 stop:2834 length:2220 start_codon:yes stop_codon:yes gene_type:complete
MPRKIRQVYTNFSAGEINNLLNARTDAKAYFEGGKQVRNWYLLDEGGVMRRPATEYMATMPAECRIIPFIFSNDEVAIFVLSNNRLDVYSNTGSVIQSNITSGCNWTTAQLFELNYAQFGDTVFVTNRNNPIIQIKRTSASTFTVSAFEFEEDEDVIVSGAAKTHTPFFKYEDHDVTLTISTAATGTGRTITASSGFFTTDYVDHYLKIDGSQVKITGYTSATEVTVTVIETIAGGTGPHYDWEEELISTPRGFPQAVSFHDNRLWFGGVRDAPSSVIASHIGGYFNFDVGTGLASEAINVAIASDTVNEIRHFVSSRNLQIFTDSGEYYVPVSSQSAAITPSSIAFLRQTPYGCNRAAPIPFDGASLFSQKNGKAIREYVFSDVEQAYRSTSVSVLASHLIDTPKQLSMMTGNETKPEQFAFFLNSGTSDDGKLAVFHSIRDEKIAGWTMWETQSGDKYHSIAALNDQLFVIVKRVVPSGTKYFLERYANDDSITLDCSTTTTVFQKGTPLVNGASQTGNTLSVDGFTSAPQIQETFTIAGNATKYTITAVTQTASGYDLTLDQNLAVSPADNAAITVVDGFVHTVNAIYESTDKVFAVYGNGSLGEFTVDSNNRITLTSAPFPTGTRVGFNFTPILETMSIDKEIDTGPLTGQPRRVNKAIVDISGGLDITMKAQDLEAKELVIQQVDFTINSDTTPVTEKKEFNFLGYSKSPTITISQNDPLPLKVLGIAMEIQFA